MALVLEQKKAEEKSRKSDGSKTNETLKEPTANYWKVHQTD